jgi:hypothetical protein
LKLNTQPGTVSLTIDNLSPFPAYQNDENRTSEGRQWVFVTRR